MGEYFLALFASALADIADARNIYFQFRFSCCSPHVFLSVSASLNDAVSTLPFGTRVIVLLAPLRDSFASRWRCWSGTGFRIFYKTIRLFRSSRTPVGPDQGII